MTVSLSPRNWAVVFSPRRRFRTPRTPLDTVDSLDDNAFSQVMNVCTPRPGRKVCDHCGTVAASARLHCVRGTSRVEDESNDYHISLCEGCMKKEDRGELKSQLRTARHAKAKLQKPARDSMRVRKVEKMKIKMKQFWKDMLNFFSKYEDGEEDSENNQEQSLKDLQELDQNLSASFHDWIMKNSLRKQGSKKKSKRGSSAKASIAEFPANEESSSPKTARRMKRGEEDDETLAEDLSSPSDGSAPQASWKQWGLLTRGRNTGTPKRKNMSLTSNSSNSNSDSSFFSVWPNCFGS